MAVTRRTLQLQQQIRDDLDLIVDAQTRDLVAAWADAWDEISPDLTATLLDMLVAGERVTRAQLLRSTRLQGALAVIREQLQGLSRDAGVRIVGDLQAVIDTAGAAQASVIDSQLPPNFMSADDLAAWSRVDARQLDAIVRRSTEQITSRLRPMPGEQYQVVRRELIRGVAAGSNPRETARRMVRRAEKGFNGGLNRAMVISRTETLDAHREGARVGRLQHVGVLAGWTWTCAMDANTCPSCWAHHGEVYPADVFGPDDHPQGRCAAVPKAWSWADLGLDIEEPPSLLPDAEATFNDLDEETQRQILGPRRFEAWQAGEYPMSAWSVKRSADGWRDSWTVSPVPQPSSGGRSSRSAA